MEIFLNMNMEIFLYINMEIFNDTNWDILQYFMIQFDGNIAGTSNGAALTYQILINTGADRPFKR